MEPLPKGLPERLTIDDLRRLFRLRTEVNHLVEPETQSVSTVQLAQEATYHEGATITSFLEAMAREYAGSVGFFWSEAAYRVFGMAAGGLALPRVTLKGSRTSSRIYQDVIELFSVLATSVELSPTELLCQLIERKRTLLNTADIRGQFGLKPRDDVNAFLTARGIAFVEVPYRNQTSGTSRFILDTAA